MSVDVKSVIGDKINLAKLKENQSKIRSIIDSEPLVLNDDPSPIPILHVKQLPPEIMQITKNLNR